MDIRKIKKLIELVKSSNISKLEVSEGKQMIRIICSSHQKSSSTPSLSNKKTLETKQYVLNNTTTHHNTMEKQTTNEHTILSPMVGIFYSAINENEKPFVSIGQSIKNGDILCIIEAMKVMNQIQSDKSGIIKDILVNNGQPVEFGEPLLIIKQ